MWKKIGQILLVGAVKGAVGSLFEAGNNGELTRKRKGGKKKKGRKASSHALTVHGTESNRTSSSEDEVLRLYSQYYS